MFTTNANPTPPPQFSQISQVPQVPQLPVMPTPQVPALIPSSQPPYTFNTNGAAPPPPTMPASYNSAPVKF